MLILLNLTREIGIFSPLLYQLSYRATNELGILKKVGKNYRSTPAKQKDLIVKPLKYLLLDSFIDCT